MPSASVATDLRCRKCRKLLIKDGELECPRCGRKVPATLGQKEIFCQNCHPWTLLAKSDQALCTRSNCKTDGKRTRTTMKTEEEMKKIETWIDEKGKRVEINPFFSKLYVDEEVTELSSKYKIWECDGESRLSTLCKAQRESLVAQVLVLVRAGRTNPTRLVGVKRTELEAVLERCSNHWYLQELINEGFFREKWVKGDVVVFPTEKLLENQRIPKTE